MRILLYTACLLTNSRPLYQFVAPLERGKLLASILPQAIRDPRQGMEQNGANLLGLQTNY